MLTYAPCVLFNPLVEALHTWLTSGRIISSFSPRSLSSADVSWVSYACGRLCLFTLLNMLLQRAVGVKQRTRTQNFIERLRKLLLATAHFALFLVSSTSPRRKNATCRMSYSFCTLHYSCASHFCCL